jgi:beta-lactam-binding protein with PASTA domain
VPDLDNMAEADAKAKLISVGLVANATDRPGVALTKIGRVVGQLPAGGVSVIKGSTVTIEIGRLALGP